MLYRIIDVNLNRSREALRVCEDVTRFALNNKILTKSLKDIRHKISRLADMLATEKACIVKYRNIDADIGKANSFDKKKPVNLKQIFYRNIHKAQESIRALEEFSKLAGMELAAHFKALRFKAYSIEKKAIKRLRALCGD